MKTATVHDLETNLTQIYAWLRDGESVVIEPAAAEAARRRETPKVNWSASAAFTRDKSGWPVLSAEDSLALIHDAQGKW